jgi:hypothetical protein
MTLPQGDRAIIDDRKIIEYCLSPDHDDGKHKVLIFREVLELTRDHAAVLVTALRETAASGEAVYGRSDR